ncbi:MAG TPA: hypothetical protein VH092_26060 [Urbifossiella sp.]|nr:hypothetical protein [Urbifossiella sp.]
MAQINVLPGGRRPLSDEPPDIPLLDFNGRSVGVGDERRVLLEILRIEDERHILFPVVAKSDGNGHCFPDLISAFLVNSDADLHPVDLVPPRNLLLDFEPDGPGREPRVASDHAGIRDPVLPRLDTDRGLADPPDFFLPHESLRRRRNFGVVQGDRLAWLEGPRGPGRVIDDGRRHVNTHPPTGVSGDPGRAVADTIVGDRNMGLPDVPQLGRQLELLALPAGDRVRGKSGLQAVHFFAPCRGLLLLLLR